MLFSIITPAEIQIFVYFGMETVQLEGKRFERIAEEGEVVKVEDSLIEYDYDFLKENVKSIIIPVIISNYEDYTS
ncbi:MAG: PTS glucose transporter subunit IIA [Leptotrichia hongkongensis]|jgi:glucose-specific phosphotransferase enzyme IIA component|nr:PTS glucose transporter subunit IIA [Leptotrichia hongkongensis]